MIANHIAQIISSEMNYLWIDLLIALRHGHNLADLVFGLIVISPIMQSYAVATILAIYTACVSIYYQMHRLIRPIGTPTIFVYGGAIFQH